MICPNCGAPIAAQTAIRGIILCDTCLRSVVEVDGRLATDADTVAVLSKDELMALKQRRRSFRATLVPV